MVEEGMTIILIASTTLLIAEALARKSNITVITNSLPAALRYQKIKDLTLVVCGGTVRHKTHSMHARLRNDRWPFPASAPMSCLSGRMALMRQTVLPHVFNEGYSISGVMAAAAQCYRGTGRDQILIVAAFKPCIADGQDRLCDNRHTISKQQDKAALRKQAELMIVQKGVGYALLIARVKPEGKVRSAITAQCPHHFTHINHRRLSINARWR